MKFKGLIEHYSFVKLSKEERDLFLIDNKIFVKSKQPIAYESESFELYNHYPHQISKIFSAPLITTKGEYTLNPQLLEQITNLILELCKERFENLFESEEVFREQFYALPPKKIEELKISTRTSNGQNFSHKLYFELSKIDYKYFHLHEDTIKYFVKYDHKYIYDYLTGLDNKSTYFFSKYHTYILNNIYLTLLEEIDEFNTLVSSEKGSVPKIIALMHELGMLDSDKFNNLSNPKKIKVVAYIMGKELTKDRTTYFRKNLTSLKPNSIMDPKGMASQHMHSILKEVLNS